MAESESVALNPLYRILKVIFMTDFNLKENNFVKYQPLKNIKK